MDDLKSRQMAAFREEMPFAFDGHIARVSSATLSGIEIINELADDAPGLRTLVSELISIAESDPRFGFLGAIPEAPVLSMSRALALERALFGSETRPVAELALLLGLYTVLLDGLLDEAPGTIDVMRPWLDSVMDLGGGQPTSAAPDLEDPITAALAWVTDEVIRRLTNLEGWRQRTVREEFAKATKAAYRSELRSVECRISDPNLRLDEARGRVLDKSTDSIWAGSLVPFCVRGWPARLEPRTFAAVAKAIGAFGGWVDDVVDVAIDLRADRWSMVLLATFEMIGTGQTAQDPRPSLIDALKLPYVRSHLASAGVSRLESVRRGLQDLGIDEATMLPALADVAEACLVGEATRAA